MVRHFMFLVIVLLFVCTAAGAAEMVESPDKCQQCSMDRTAYARSRMLIDYTDRTSAGVCSLHCAVEEMNKNKGKQVKSLQVADYTTRVLIDARTATWVVGGKQNGGMNSPAKWAFAREEEAQKFVRENGGNVTPFDQVLKTAKEEVADDTEMNREHNGHMGHDMNHMGPGGQMLFNPAFGDDIYHTHPAGMWMANYKYMHMAQVGLRNGTRDVPASDATPVGNQPFGYMMAPTSMTMDMHMAMVMYGLTDRLTLMGMGGYLVNEMKMVMNMGMGMGNRPEPSMSTRGIGDTELRGIYKISNYLNVSLGLGIPTGDIDQEFVTMGTKYRAPYDMQLGSGTVDLKPALTFTALSDDAKWNLGGQASYIYHVDHNGNGYSLGDSAKVIGWLQRALGPVTTWLRLAYNYSGSINGRDPEIDKLLVGASTPDADPANYGGHRLDGFAGVSWTAGPVSIGVEAGIPFYQDLNGLQLKNDWYLTSGIQGMF
jgi:nitrous oxide reductase accessory protein NosL